MFDGVICKYFGGGLSVYIFVGLESPKILIHVCIGLEAQIEDKDMSEDKHSVSQRPTVVGEEGSVNRNSPRSYVKDEPFID